MHDVHFEDLGHGITMIDAQLYRQGQVSTCLVEMAHEHANGGADRHQILCEAMMQLLIRRLRDHECALPEEEIRELLAPDVDLNAQGLEVWLDKAA